MTAEEIRQLRSSMGLTRVEFARKWHVHPDTVARWETGHAVPIPYLRYKMGQALAKRKDRILVQRLMQISQ